MLSARIVDAFDLFTAWWERVQSLDVSDQVNAWEDLYAGQLTELGRKQIRSYDEDGLDWRDVARERIMPHLASRLPAMAVARGNLLSVIHGVFRDAQLHLGVDFPVVFVIYVGIAVGAGWATTFDDTPACLFGLENIAELNWTDQGTLAALCAHELGHLAHEHWRAKAGLADGEGPWWHLYQEGFAMRCEHLVMGRETWHEQAGQQGWLAWCAAHKGRLARELSSRLERGEDAREFFGSWYDLNGFKQCGYYVGHEVVKQMEQGMPLREIALLPYQDAEFRMRDQLHRLRRCL